MNITGVKSIPRQSFFWSVFSCIWTECWDLRSKINKMNYEFLWISIIDSFSIFKISLEILLNWIENWGKNQFLINNCYWKLNGQNIHGDRAVRVYFVQSISKCFFSLKLDFYPNFQFNLISYFLIRFWIWRHKSIMEVQFLKWKSKIQFSIFNFWKQKYFLIQSSFQ